MTRIRIDNPGFAAVEVDRTPDGSARLVLDLGKIRFAAILPAADAERLGRALLGAGPAPVVEPVREKARHEWPARRPGPGPGPGPDAADRPPTSGKGLFRWLRTQEERIGSPGLLGYLDRWARLREFPARMIDWDRAQVAEAHAEAVRKLAEVAAPEELREEVRP